MWIRIRKGAESRAMNKGWKRWQRMETNMLKDGKGTEGRRVEKGADGRDKWNWGREGREKRGDRWLKDRKGAREGRQMRMRLVKGPGRGDRCNHGL
jgi:hypothetical protein